MNYFELFELPVSLYVDPAGLQKKYYELSRKFHPDYHAQENETEQAAILENASMVNKAYKVFLNPEETIRYVLGMKGLIEEEEKYQLDPAFLMEVLEINEELMEADEDVGFQKTRVKANDLMQRIAKEIEPLILNYKDGKTSEAELLRVKDYYYKKKYIHRILDTLDGRERNKP